MHGLCFYVFQNVIIHPCFCWSSSVYSPVYLAIFHLPFSLNMPEPCQPCFHIFSIIASFCSIFSRIISSLNRLRLKAMHLLSQNKIDRHSIEQWRFYIGARGAKPPKSRKRKDLAPQIPRVVHNFFAGVVTLTELTGSAIATYEANEAISSVKLVAQWCTTPGPRATSGPRRVLVWPAVSNKESAYFNSDR